MARKPLSNKVRFEVFKRDKFTCQYCGKAAPEVVLNCDHIVPVADGGANELLNLITSCFACNNGKRAKRLDDHSELSVQVDEIKVLHDRREQIAMLKKWRDECRDADEEAISVIDQEFDRAYGCRLTDSQKSSLGRLIKKYGLREVLLCAVISIEHYDDSDEAFKKIQGIIKSRELDRVKPGLGKLPYIAGILHRRYLYVDATELRELVEESIDLGVDIEAVVEAAKRAKNWTKFREAVWLIMDEKEEANRQELRDIFEDGVPANPFDDDREVW